MKKAKLLIPAIAVLAMSTAAAVTGTVAWFTASRTAKLTEQSTTVVNGVAGLKMTLTEGTGTSVSELAVTHAGNFTDGSVDLTNAKVYSSEIGNDGTVASFKDATGTMKKGNEYVATKYTITFELGNKKDLGTYGIYLDHSKTVVTTTTQVSETNNDTMKDALRVGFKSTAGVDLPTNPFAIQPSKTSADGAGLKYVDGTVLSTNEHLYSDADADLFMGLSKADLPASDTQDNCYLGRINKDTVLKVDVYTWFEGTSFGNISADVLATFGTTLNFAMLAPAA